jgi:hypothetical protein
MRMRVLLLAGAVVLISGCGRITFGSTEPQPGSPPSAQQLPRTRAERTQYRETSSHADVLAFLDSLQSLGARMHVQSIGTTGEGRELPMVILSRPLVSDPVEARRLRRPVVFVQGNIHGGEIEGKEALQALVRDLVFAPGATVLDSIVLLVLPIYNADGNERLGPQERNRGSQQGPALVGERANAQGLDLNRDYVKAEAPETQAALALFARWDPDVFVDLHTTNGSYHGYALTYAPSLNPAAVHGGAYARDTMLPELRRRMRARHDLETFDYGNFISEEGAPRGWATYDARPRFGTNYYGLRGRIAILSEAYSHDPLERRVRATSAFVREILSLTAERSSQILALSADADQLTAHRTLGRVTRQFPLRSRLIADPPSFPVLVETVVNTGDNVRYEPGMPPGRRRTGEVAAVSMPVHDRFQATLQRTIPFAYAIPAEEIAAVRLLRLHSIRVERLERAWTGRVESFAVSEVSTSPRVFQGHRERMLEGRWNAERVRLGEGTFIVPSDQRLGLLAFYLLEAESDDGLATWNQIWRGGGATFSVRRVVEPVNASRRALP